jgi:hypothetical protein
MLPKLLFLLACAAAQWLAPSSAFVQALDPHRIYEQRCATCHAPHAANFARQALDAREGSLVGKKSGKELAGILPRHRGTEQTAAEIEALAELFRRNLSSGSLYQRKCIVCHDRARDFARVHLVLANGVLKGRYSGYVTRDFLSGHGRLTEPEVAQMLATLQWQLETREP